MLPLFTAIVHHVKGSAQTKEISSIQFNSVLFIGVHLLLFLFCT